MVAPQTASAAVPFPGDTACPAERAGRRGEGGADLVCRFKILAAEISLL